MKQSVKSIDPITNNFPYYFISKSIKKNIGKTNLRYDFEDVFNAMLIIKVLL